MPEAWTMTTELPLKYTQASDFSKSSLSFCFVDDNDDDDRI